MDQSEGLPEVVTESIRHEVQDAHVSSAWATRLSVGRFRGIPTLHHSATTEGAIKDALLPRRGALGSEAAEQPALVQDRRRVGGSMDTKVIHISG